MSSCNIRDLPRAYCPVCDRQPLPPEMVALAREAAEVRCAGIPPIMSDTVLYDTRRHGVALSFQGGGQGYTMYVPVLHPLEARPRG